jgi:hypothetical protein
MVIASFNAGGDRRADRPHFRQQPRSYQVTLGGLGKAAATQRWQVGHNRQPGMEPAAVDPSLSRTPDATISRE